MSRRRGKVLWIWHAAFIFFCRAAHSFHWHLDYGCVKAVLEAGFALSFSHRYTLNISFLGGTGKRFSSHSLPLHWRKQMPISHCSLWGLLCFLHLWSNSSSWRTYHSSAGRYLLRVERNTILLFGMPHSRKNRLDTSIWRVLKWGGHPENYTPCSSQKPEVFSDQTAELIQPCAES